LFETSTVPSVQLVLVMVPAAESTVVVPAELQFHVGEFAKVHWVASTFTDGGTARPGDSQPVEARPSQSSVPGPHAAQVPPEHVCAMVQIDVVHVVPQLVSRSMRFSHPFDGDPSQSRVPEPHATHAPPEHVWVSTVHGTAVPHWPFEPQV
jgi:hypothetical protein